MAKPPARLDPKKQLRAAKKEARRAANKDARRTLARWFTWPALVVAGLAAAVYIWDQRSFTVTTHQGPMPTAEELAQSTDRTRERAPGAVREGEQLVPPSAPGDSASAPLDGSALRPVFQPNPDYPDRALDAAREGVVKLRVTVAPDGSVTSADVIEAEPEGWFERAAREGVMRWRFEPLGREASTEVSVEFKLE